MVSISSCSRADTGQHSASHATLLREKQRRAVAASTAGECTPMTKSRYSPASSMRSKLYAIASRRLPTNVISATQATTTCNHNRPGRAELHGQVRDDETCRTVCMSLCEGVSCAGITAVETGTARQAMRSDGGRTSIRTGLLSHEEGTHSRSGSWHDACGSRDISLLLRCWPGPKKKRLRQSQCSSNARADSLRASRIRAKMVHFCVSSTSRERELSSVRQNRWPGICSLVSDHLASRLALLSAITSMRRLHSPRDCLRERRCGLSLWVKKPQHSHLSRSRSSI